jgi:hypothetical protein
MGIRGLKPKGKVKIEWSANFAYAIGLIVTDGCLYKDGRHIAFVSKDLEQIKNFMKCFEIKNKIGTTASGYDGNKAFRVQFGDVTFYNFLREIGISPNKSKTIEGIIVPAEYFFDFLRGCFDGDGCFYSYWDPRWRSSFMYYLQFCSASRLHIFWLRKEIKKNAGRGGYITKSKNMRSVYTLRFAKKEALEIIQKMYYSPTAVCLSRKKHKIEKALEIERKQQMVYKNK